MKSISDQRLTEQLYRFQYFLARPEDWPEAYEYPEAWDDYTWRDTPDKPIPQARANVQRLLNRPGALEPVPKPPEPVPLPQTRSPLFSVLPPELRTWIFELVLTRDDTIMLPSDTSRDKAYPSSITQVSRLVPRETLPLFFKSNHFLFDTVCSSRALGNNLSKNRADRQLLKWLTPMGPHLPLLHHITIQVPRREDTFPKWDYPENPTITLCHDPQRNCWSVVSSDDWSSVEDSATRASLECDSTVILPRLLERMLDQRSCAYLSPAYLMWLFLDLQGLYAGEKIEDRIPRSSAWHHVGLARNSAPPFARPPNMYTRYLLGTGWSPPSLVEYNN